MTLLPPLSFLLFTIIPPLPLLLLLFPFPPFFFFSYSYIKILCFSTPPPPHPPPSPLFLLFLQFSLFLYFFHYLFLKLTPVTNAIYFSLPTNSVQRRAFCGHPSSAILPDPHQTSRLIQQNRLASLSVTAPFYGQNCFLGLSLICYFLSLDLYDFLKQL